MLYFGKRLCLLPKLPGCRVAQLDRGVEEMTLSTGDYARSAFTTAPMTAISSLRGTISNT